MKIGLAAAAFVAGAGLGFYFVPGASWAAACAAVGIATLCAVCSPLLLPASRPSRLGLLIGAAMLAGALHGNLAVQTPAPVPTELRSTERVELEGVLARDARPYGDGHLLAIDVERYLAGDSWRPGGFRVDAIAGQLAGAGAAGRAPDGFLAGDRYAVTGQIIAAAWSPAASRGSGAIVRNAEVVLLGAEESAFRRVLGTVRANLGRSVDRSSPEPAAGLIKAMVTGSRAGLAPATRDAFRRSGTSHILAISGMHLGIVAFASLGAAAWLFGRRRQLYLIVPAASVWGYAALAGFTAPVSRAAIMASIYIGARALGRQRSVAPALGLAAAGMVALSPATLGDVSFQLSFLAVLGIALVTPSVERAGAAALEHLGRRLPESVSAFLEKVNAGVAMSIGALSLTAPVVALRFDAISVWGTPATLLQVPALPFLIVAGIVEAALGLAWHPLGLVAALPAWGLAGYVIGVADLFAGLPGGAIQPGGPAMAVAAAYYLALLVVVVRRRLSDWAGAARSRWSGAATAAAAYSARPVRPRKGAPRLLLLPVLIAASLAWGGALSLPDGGLRVTFFETEGGDSILIRTPSGRQVLIDGGDSSLGAVRALSSRMPFWDRSLDIVVLTHPHADHARGLLAVLERYRVDTILDSPSEYDSAVYRDWLAAAEREGGRRISAVPGTVITLDYDTRLEVLFAEPQRLAPDPNDRSIVARLVFGEAAFLLTGDLSSVAERRLLDAGHDVRATVLKVGHQGSKGSSSDAFLAAVSPSIAVVPASIGNRYGHPHPEALDRVARFVDSERLLVTRDRGTVDIETDGRSYRVRTER